MAVSRAYSTANPSEFFKVLAEDCRKRKKLIEFLQSL